MGLSVACFYIAVISRVRVLTVLEITETQACSRIDTPMTTAGLDTIPAQPGWPWTPSPVPLLLEKDASDMPMI